MKPRAHLSEILRLLEERYGLRRRGRTRKVLDELLLVLLAHDLGEEPGHAPSAAARRALEDLSRQYVDWNHLRVARLYEVARVIEGTGARSGRKEASASGPSRRSEKAAQRLLDVLRQIKTYARRHRIELILFRDFTGPRHDIEDALVASGFQAVPNVPTVRMTIPWKSFEDYLSALRKSYRNDIRRKIKRKRAQDIRTVVTSDGGDMVDRYVELHGKVRERANRFGRDNFGRPFFLSMLRNLQEHNHWMHYFQGDRLVGFLQFVTYRRTLWANIAGFDYDVSRKAMLYFNAYYDMIQYAIENGLETVDVGITTYVAKSAMGFSVIPQSMYAWYRSPMLLGLFSRLFGAIARHGLDRCHVAFKDARLQHIWDGRTR